MLNDRYELGSVLTVHAVAEAMTRGGDILPWTRMCYMTSAS